MKICTATMENSMEIPQNIKGRAIITSNNFISWYLFKENKNTNKKICMHCQVYYSFIYIGQDMKQPKSCQHVDKKDLVSIQNTA